jgi:hypothetical protein
MTTTQPAHTPGRTTTASIGTPETTNAGLRRSALVAGIGILVLAVLAAGAYVGIIQGLVTEGNATKTANDIADSEGLFRLAIAALAIVVILDMVVALALLTFFTPVHKGLATLAAWMRLGYAAIFAVAIGQLVGVLPLVGNDQYLTTFSTDQRSTDALLKIQAFEDLWSVGYVLFGLHLVLIGYLAYKSGYVPRVIGVLLAIAGGGYLVDSFGGLLIENYSITHGVAPGERAEPRRGQAPMMRRAPRHVTSGRASRRGSHEGS